MKIQTLLFLSVSLICQSYLSISKTNLVQEQKQISGRYINMTFLNKTLDELPSAIPAYCFEMNFTGANKVNIFYGFEEAKLSYRKEKDHFVLLKAYQGKDMFFTFNRDSTITLLDSVWTGIAGNSQFKKMNKIDDHKWVFEYYLNDKLIAGDYILYKQNKRTRRNVIFKPNGKVTGLKNFVRYTLCYSGDCVGETEPLSNIITFEDTDNVTTNYSFKVDTKTRALSIYELSEPVEDIKGNRKVKGMIFDLRK